MGTILEKVYEELRTVPITLMFMAGIYVAVAVLWSDHVSKADFRELKKEVMGLQYTLRHDHADTRLHAVEQELFNLTQHRQEEIAKGHVVDALYDQRINDLNNQHAEIMRDMLQLERMQTRTDVINDP